MNAGKIPRGTEYKNKTSYWLVIIKQVIIIIWKWIVCIIASKHYTLYITLIQQMNERTKKIAKA